MAHALSLKAFSQMADVGTLQHAHTHTNSYVSTRQWYAEQCRLQHCQQCSSVPMLTHTSITSTASSGSAANDTRMVGAGLLVGCKCKQRWRSERVSSRGCFVIRRVSSSNACRKDLIFRFYVWNLHSIFLSNSTFQRAVKGWERTQVSSCETRGGQQPPPASSTHAKAWEDAFTLDDA